MSRCPHVLEHAGCHHAGTFECQHQDPSVPLGWQRMEHVPAAGPTPTISSSPASSYITFIPNQKSIHGAYRRLKRSPDLPLSSYKSRRPCNTFPGHPRKHNQEKKRAHVHAGN